jgi:hypothetical protein
MRMHSSEKDHIGVSSNIIEVGWRGGGEVTRGENPKGATDQGGKAQGGK